MKPIRKKTRITKTKTALEASLRLEDKTAIAEQTLKANDKTMYPVNA